MLSVPPVPLKSLWCRCAGETPAPTSVGSGNCLSPVPLTSFWRSTGVPPVPPTSRRPGCAGETPAPTSFWRSTGVPPVPLSSPPATFNSPRLLGLPPCWRLRGYIIFLPHTLAQLLFQNCPRIRSILQADFNGMTPTSRQALHDANSGTPQFKGQSQTRLSNRQYGGL